MSSKIAVSLLKKIDAGQKVSLKDNALLYSERQVSGLKRHAFCKKHR
jgi:hypothetical protein